MNPTANEIASVLIRGPALALRYPSPANGSKPDGGMYVCSDPGYDFGSLTPNARSHTRRGLARCAIDRIGFDYLARHGYDLLADTAMRQTGGRPSISPANWARFCRAAALRPDIEVWGAFAENRLAAFIVGMMIDDCFYIHLQKSDTALLKYYPNNALTFEVTRNRLASGAAEVSHGQIALAASAGLDAFKRGMGFQVKPFKERVVFHPLFRPTLWLGRGIASLMERVYPKNLFLQRVTKSLELAGGD
ncbi:MAG TPA: GNAT family N-acetyltransferase [Candidatus Binataceae bacterium]|nr:GNAT family N-acetyltransferase [Candidatus Binataceae bacterium]